jgi:integrase
MKTKTPTGRASKGSVTAIFSNGRIQLRFHFAGKRHYISTGYPDTPQHCKLAQLKASEIEKDILCERFDPKDLSKYSPEGAARKLTPITPSKSLNPTSQNYGRNIQNFNDLIYRRVPWQRIIKKLTDV